ncbi:arginase family protein [Rhodococcus sp. 114MFTsu3.1]|uniref:arginase family protein n=1 Tax=Rhodococcus sp. 114MFTsu3.1 TaxID=1172184 RepID=UPI0003636898|nr:arginase family protein [Rhodococcus sp. 114MFTsu3.1]
MPDSEQISKMGVDAGARFSGLATFMRAPYKPDGLDLDIALAGLPYDFQSGRGSAKQGPRQIRDMSGLIRRLSYGGVEPFELCRIADVGDAVLNPMDPRQSIERATEFVASLADRGATVVAAGGDHGATYPMLKGLVRSGPVGLVHFDAHPDTYDDPYGGYIHHGNAVRAAIEDNLVDPAHTITVGIHGTRFVKSDRNWHSDHGMGLLTVDDVADLGIAGTVAEIRRVLGDIPTYITFDVDALDTPFAIGTGAPEPGGLTMRESLGILRGLHGLDIIGGDVMEVAPPFDPSGHTALNAANLMFEIVCATALSISNKRAASADRGAL